MTDSSDPFLLPRGARRGRGEAGGKVRHVAARAGG